LSILSRLKTENKGNLAASVFYAIAGIIFLAWMILTGFPPHLAIIGIFSLITAYGIIRKRAWAIWLVIILFFIATTFSAILIYNILASDIILTTAAIAYLILTWIFTAYIAANRNTLQT
jgi:hypothetical protein